VILCQNVNWTLDTQGSIRERHYKICLVYTSSLRMEGYSPLKRRSLPELQGNNQYKQTTS
jgi:hypothetical protein